MKTPHDDNASTPHPRKRTTRRFENLFCECGQPAVTRSANSMACQRCADSTAAGEFQTKSGKADRPERHVGWTDFRVACLAFFERNGMESGAFHG